MRTNSDSLIVVPFYSNWCVPLAADGTERGCRMLAEPFKTNRLFAIIAITTERARFDLVGARAEFPDPRIHNRYPQTEGSAWTLTVHRVPPGHSSSPTEFLPLTPELVSNLHLRHDCLVRTNGKAIFLLLCQIFLHCVSPTSCERNSSPVRVVMHGPCGIRTVPEKIVLLFSKKCNGELSTAAVLCVRGTFTLRYPKITFTYCVPWGTIGKSV